MRGSRFPASMSRLRVVIAGAGFAGLTVAKELEDDCDVTLVAPTDRFVYVPLIHEVLSDKTLPTEVTRKLSDVLKKTKLVHARAGRVEGKELITAAGERIAFDKLVIAVGSEPNDFGVKGVRENALTFSNVGDALRGNGALRTIASDVTDHAVRVIVIGGGFTGVEVAGEAKELLEKLGVAHEILILDALPDIFPRQSAGFRAKIREALDEQKIQLKTGQRIVEVRKDGVVAAPAAASGREDSGDKPKPAGFGVAVAGRDEPLPADLVFWCAGVKPRAVDGVDPNVRVTLQSVADDDVFVVGDAARFPREMGVPQLAQTAEDQANVVAWNILYPDRPRFYEPSVRGIIVSVGHGKAVAELAGGMVLTGQIPWHVKRQLYKAKIALI